MITTYLSCFSVPLLPEPDNIDLEFIPPHYFKSHYALHGRDWIKALSMEDRRALCLIGYKACPNLARIGGQARAIKAQRDNRGRFIANT